MSRARDIADGKFSGDLEADSPTFVVDSANNRVGIGTSSPLGRLAVQAATGLTGFNTGTSSSPERGNLWYDTDGTGWKFNIGKLQGGTFTPQMTFQDNGTVGIGTSSPAAQLHVANSGGNSTSILGQYGSGTRAEVTAASNEVVIKAYNGTNDVMTFYTGASERMRIDSSGNVAIGQSSTTGGNTILDLHKSGNGVGSQIRYANDHSSGYYVGLAGNTTGEGIIWNEANAGMVFGTNNTERMRIDSAGRVTMPYQPAFSAFNLATGSQYPSTYGIWATFDSNLTNFDSPRYAAEVNVGSHFSTSNGRFTAPVAGQYLISVNVSMWVGNTTYVVIFKNGSHSAPYQLVYNANLGGYQTSALSRVMALAAGDYVQPGFYALSGTYATFIPGGGYLQFSGHLIG